MKTKNNLIKITLSILFIGFMFTACSKDDEEDDVQQTTGAKHLNPPAWIQAKWMDHSDPNLPTGYEFTEDDMLTIVGSNSVSVKATLTDDDNISENSTNTSYQFTITHTASNNSTESWQFTLLDPTHLQAEHGGVTGTYIKE